MNSSNHNNCMYQIEKKRYRDIRKNASDINIIACEIVQSTQFSDRWLGALLCIFADIWFAYWQQLTKRAATRSVCSSITSLECGMNKFFSFWQRIRFDCDVSLHVWVISHIKTIWVGGIFFFHFWLEAFPILSLVDFHHLHVIILMYWRTNSFDCYKKNGPAFRSSVRNKSHFNRLCLWLYKRREST